MSMLGRVKQHLWWQLDFICASCERFDLDAPQEGVRIATAVRVIFRQTNSSQAILTQLNAWSTNIVSSVEPVDVSGLIAFDALNWHGGVPFRVSNPMPAEEWWHQPVYKHSGFTWTREEIVCDTANQDGGAHVQPEPDDKTRALVQGGLWVDQENHPIAYLHLYKLRTIGQELLLSDDLRRLTEGIH